MAISASHSPSVATERLGEYQSALAAVAEFEELERGNDVVVETTRSYPRVREMFHQVLGTARESVRALDRPPYLNRQAGQAAAQAASLAQGVEYRVVYETKVLQDPFLLTVMRESAAQGEAARVAPTLPFRCQIADDRVALIMRQDQAGDIVATKVAEPHLVAALGDLFEVTWGLSVPLPLTGDDDIDSQLEPTSESLQLPGLLTMGMTDDAIARQLGVSARTVARRLSKLSLVLGASGRFQLAIQAMRKGWIEPS